MSTPARGGYAAWVRWLEAFRRGENPPTHSLGPVNGGFGSYVEARLLERLSSAFAERVRQWQTALGDRIVARPPDGPVAASAMLHDAVLQLEPLARLAGSPLLPRSLASSMHAMLVGVREGARTALDEAWRRRLEDEHAGLPAPRGLDGTVRPTLRRARGPRPGAGARVHPALRRG